VLPGAMYIKYVRLIIYGNGVTIGGAFGGGSSPSPTANAVNVIITNIATTTSNSNNLFFNNLSSLSLYFKMPTL
jgi:hypothetical protein